ATYATVRRRDVGQTRFFVGEWERGTAPQPPSTTTRACCAAAAWRVVAPRSEWRPGVSLHHRNTVQRWSPHLPTKRLARQWRVAACAQPHRRATERLSRNC